MKKIFLLISFCVASVCYAENKETIEKIAKTRSNLDFREYKLDEETSIKVAAIDKVFQDVLKTSHQLVPKYANSIVITGTDENYTEEMKEKLNLLINANLLYDGLTIYIDKNNNLSLIAEILKQYDGCKTINYDGYQDLIHKIKSENEIRAKKLGIDENGLLNRRVVIFTRATNMRGELSRVINALGKNEKEIILDNYSYLDGITRKDLDEISKSEIYEAYMSIDYNK